MELLLWRWSMAVQLTSTVMIVVFFAVLMRSVRSAELRWWMYAWAADLSALGVSLFFWYYQPQGAVVPLLRGLYLASKTAFVLLLIQGAWALYRPGVRVLRARQAVPAVAAFSVAGAFLLNSIPKLGVGQHLLLGVLFAYAGVALLRGGRSGLTWLGSGLLLRAALALVETGAYLLELVPRGSVPPGVQGSAAIVLAAHSSFDSGMEWLLALGCVLALSDRVHRELQQFNRELLAAQDDLRKLADHDPLTGLANRRALPEVLRSVRDTGATLLFFDLDGFKEINDVHGHAAGDECLKRFAAALRESFGPDAGVVRYAGDEFVVVTHGPDPDAGAQHLGRLRQRLRPSPGDAFAIRFSTGVADLPAGGDADAALQAADEAMYRVKGPRRPPRGAPFRVPLQGVAHGTRTPVG